MVKKEGTLVFGWEGLRHNKASDRTIVVRRFLGLLATFQLRKMTKDYNLNGAWITWDYRIYSAPILREEPGLEGGCGTNPGVRGVPEEEKGHFQQPSAVEFPVIRDSYSFHL